MTLETRSEFEERIKRMAEQPMREREMLFMLFDIRAEMREQNRQIPEDNSKPSVVAVETPDVGFGTLESRPKKKPRAKKLTSR